VEFAVALGMTTTRNIDLKDLGQQHLVPFTRGDSLLNPNPEPILVTFYVRVQIFIEMSLQDVGQDLIGAWVRVSIH
jgi:hypothetical protein